MDGPGGSRDTGTISQFTSSAFESFVPDLQPDAIERVIWIGSWISICKTPEVSSYLRNLHFPIIKDLACAR